MFLLLLVVLYFAYMCRYFRTFSRQGIPVECTPLPCFGTSLPLFQKGIYEAYRGLLQKYGNMYGAYGGRMPILVTIDPEIIRDVFIKDTETFPSRNRFVSGDPLNDDMLSNIVDYEKWKYMRTIMSPTFSSGKLKRMMPQINQCAKQLLQHLEKPCKEGKSVEMKDYAGCYTMDVIASTAFGLDLNSRSDENNDFVKYAKMAFEVNLKHPIILLIVFFPFLIPLLPYLKLRIAKPEIRQFFTGVINQIIEARAEDKQAEERVDFVRLMMDAHKEQSGEGGEELDSKTGEEKRKMTRDELVAQCFLFFLAGYDTTATTISFLAHNLAVHPDIQEKLVEEIEQVMGDRDVIKDEDLHEMPYLEQCTQETLRMYPPAALTERCADREVTVKGVTLPKGGFVRVPIHEMHHHPDLYPEPEQFRPERFSTEEKAKRNPVVFMPFGAGPRQCLATRLALLEVKLAIATLLRKYKLVRAPETEHPIKIGGLGLLKAENGVWIKLEARAK